MAKMLKTETIQVTCNEIIIALREAGLSMSSNPNNIIIRVTAGDAGYEIKLDTKFEFTYIAEPEEMPYG